MAKLYKITLLGLFITALALYFFANTAGRKAATAAQKVYERAVAEPPKLICKKKHEEVFYDNQYVPIYYRDLHVSAITTAIITLVCAAGYKLLK